jgi:branched-subunit amino acid aminotransferase/4-amino-4-deoxychorismate lyase
VKVIIDGAVLPASEASISVFDWGVQRGDGAFEVIRSYRGKLFALDQHLDRLANSLRLLEMEMPDRMALSSWAEAMAAEGGDCLVRCVITRGGALDEVAAPSRTVVTHEPMPQLPDTIRLLPLTAPWHSASGPYELTGAKVISYAPNMAATRHAQAEGYDDTLLLSIGGAVLEGPTFSVAWVKDGVLYTPGLDLRILASITRAEVLKAAAEIGIEVREVAAPLDVLLAADEAIALSTVKEVWPVGAVGTHEFAAGPVQPRLAAAFKARVAAAL